MDSREVLLFLACLLLLSDLRFTHTTTTTSLVAAMSIANQDLERYFHSANRTQALASEERIAMDVYTYAFLNYSYMENQQLKVVNYQEEKARYGEGKILTVQGKLIHISTPEDLKDDSACSFNLLGTNGQPLPLFSVSWIALVRRGRCTFEEKVKNVFLNGASGVIIFNDKPVMNLEKMQIKGKARNITAVITYQDIGLEMALRLDQGFDVTAHIIEGRSGMRPINSLNRTSVLFVAISFVILLVISLVWLIFYYIQKFRYMQSKDQQSRHLCSVTKKAIMKIPTKTGKSTDEKDAESDCCAICIEAYKSSDLIRVLPCRHEFHKNCIDPWLIEHRTCPMCKLDVLKFYGYVVGDEIHTTPTPRHIPANGITALDGRDLPIIVVLPQPPPLQPTTSSSSASASASSSTSSSSSTTTAASCATATALAAINSNNIPSRLSATQASVETQTITTIEPHSSREDIETHLQNYHRTPPPPPPPLPAPASESTAITNAMPAVAAAVSSSNSYHLNSNSNNIFVDSNSNSNQAWSLSFSPAQLSTQVNTGSHLFIGSEESILEFPAENTTDSSINPAAANSSSRPSGALADLIRSRDFVIDFPRVFVLEGGTETRRRSTVFNSGIPERSQSSMGLSQAKDWMCTVANKLEEQHGLRKARKDSQKMEMQENLLSVRQESMKMRRSHSTEGRYCVRRELDSPEALAYAHESNVEGACGGVQNVTNSCSTSRRNSTSTVISQLQPVVALKFDILNKRRKSNTSCRPNDANLKTWSVKETEVQPKPKEDDLPNIRIEIVDEDN